MPDLTTLLSRLHDPQECQLTELEAFASEHIAHQSGARRGMIGEPPVFAVQPISLDPHKTKDEFDATIGWIARRFKESGVRTFELALRRQPHRLILTARWNRQFPGAGPAPTAKAAPGFAR